MPYCFGCLHCFKGGVSALDMNLLCPACFNGTLKQAGASCSLSYIVLVLFALNKRFCCLYFLVIVSCIELFLGHC